MQNLGQELSSNLLNEQECVVKNAKGSEAQNEELSNQLPLQDQNLAQQFIEKLLQPKKFINKPMYEKFEFKSQQIKILCDQAETIIKQQPMVLKCKAPVKIFGDLHGQYSDLMRFFDLWGYPCTDNGEDGDIDSFDYLFLGNYVDKGPHSLETICLLLALKIKFPEYIHLMRGNHEDKWINNSFGFSDECSERLGENTNDEDSVFNRVNRLFEWLPLAAIIEEKIICLNGGIGSQFNFINQIENIQRPLEVMHEIETAEEQLIYDILWSKPTDSDQDFGIQPNQILCRGAAYIDPVVKFGPDRVLSFLQRNNLSLIIKAQQCVMDGFERFASGQLITVFSAIDYCGRHKNAGAMLLIKKSLEIVPKLIYPQIQNVETEIQRPPFPPRWKVSGKNSQI